MRVSVKNDPFILRFSVIPAYKNTTRIDHDLCAPLLYLLNWINIESTSPVDVADTLSEAFPFIRRSLLGAA